MNIGKNGNLYNSDVIFLTNQTKQAAFYNAIHPPSLPYFSLPLYSIFSLKKIRPFGRIFEIRSSYSYQCRRAWRGVR